MTTNERIIRSIFKAIDEVNQQLPKDHQLEKSIDTIIQGTTGGLDSLGLVNLIVATEEKIEEDFGVTVTLADEKVFSQMNGPLKDIGTLSEYISLLLNENTNE